MTDTLPAVFADKTALPSLLAAMRAEIDAHTPDVSTVSGRKAIASLAFKITKTKTALDAHGKALNEAAREQINAVDAIRRQVREKLDALAEEARRPLSEWEAAEGARVEKVKEIRDAIRSSTQWPFGASVAEIEQAIWNVKAEIIDAETFREEQEAVEREREAALTELGALLARAKTAEAERAELERLRQERAEQEAKAAEQAARREAEERARRAEEERKRQIEAAEKAAADKAKADAERAHQAELAQVKREAEEAQRKADAEAKRIADEAAAKERAAQAERDAAAKREADKAHRAAVMKAMKEALMRHGEVEEAAAKKIVLALVAGEIPNTAVRF